ncbi:hypothetical protein L1D19_05905 [Vibrio natriegens]|uniref:hypothetical protein n=1 Tax=Vibrio natriegens TaxID=691 RepID=UPI001EFC71F5|nr:hypothetical protein [Vibrio natriegens]MCG9699666.1 hypothetical protein [Vibrio natriegens]
MSNKTYPRIGSATKLSAKYNHNRHCKCGEKAEFSITVQYNYMRGDDDAFCVCSTHKNDIEFLINKVVSNEQ